MTAMHHAAMNVFEPGLAAVDGPDWLSLPPDDDERRRSADASEKVALLGEMARGVAHDLGNVLAVIESGLRLAEENLERPEALAAFFAGIRDGIGRGRRLTSRLLGFARPGEIEDRAVDANALLERMAPFLKYAAGPGIRVTFRLGERIPICTLEASQFSAAVLNLVVNARDAMSEGGEIEISTQCRDGGAAAKGCGYLLVSVTDTGTGMSAETQRRAFQTWFTTKGESGTGLGLPQVRHFVEASGGHVRLSSEPGVGTRFDMIFPAAANEAARSADLCRQLDRWTNEGGRPEPTG